MTNMTEIPSWTYTLTEGVIAMIFYYEEEDLTQEFYEIVYEQVGKNKTSRVSSMA